MFRYKLTDIGGTLAVCRAIPREWLCTSIEFFFVGAIAQR